MLKPFVYLFLLNLLLHLPFVQLPPVGNHMWRQCNTIAVAKNFAFEDNSIIYPRIDRRNETNGITGMPFPLYEWTLGVGIKLFGFSNLLVRLYSLLISTFALFSIYLISLYITKVKFWAWCSSLLLFSLPEFYYHSINALPDVLAMVFALYSLYYWLKIKEHLNSLNESKNKLIILFFYALLTSTLAGLIKIQFLIIPFSTVILFYKSKKNTFYVVLSLLLAFLINILWYYYAINLTKSNNLKEFGLWLKPITIKEGIQSIIQNIVSDTPELLIGWPLFLFLIYLIFKTFKKIQLNPYNKIGILWFIFFIVFYFFGIERMKNHAYYFMVLLPLIVMFSIHLFRLKAIKKQYIYFILFMNFTWTILRIVPNNWINIEKQLPKEFTEKKYLDEFKSYIKPGDRVFIGPDKSGCIYFYFTNTKGFSFANENELFELDTDTIKLNKVFFKKANKLIIKDVKYEKKLLETFPYVKFDKNIGSFRVYNLLDNKQ